LSVELLVELVQLGDITFLAFLLYHFEESAELIMLQLMFIVYRICWCCDFPL